MSLVLSTTLARPAARSRLPYALRCYSSGAKPFASPLSSHTGPLEPAIFAEQYLGANRPMHMRTLLTPAQWPALSKWSRRDPETGRETLAGMRHADTESLIVPVELARRGRGYMDQQGGWERLEMPFGAYLPWRLWCDVRIGRRD